MNDRFKYRVYYKPHNKVYNVVCLNCDRQNEIIIEYKGSTAVVEWKNCEILQSTGLKDKNGKLIYEGDICKYKFEEIGEQKAIIYFNKELCSFLAKPLNDFQYTKINNCEVIGNIYLDSHLLEN